MRHQINEKEISAAVSEAEKYTTGEIIPMIVARSDDYPGARWRLAVVFAMLAGFVTYYFAAQVDPIWILWMQIPGLYLGYALGGVDAILRPFLSAAKVDEEVHQRAVQSFFAQNLHDTKDRTGILIMVSLLENRVEIMADTGINAKVSSNAWTSIVEDMIGKVKSDDLSSGLCLAIQECGQVLAKDFPGTNDNPNEIVNKVIVEL